MTPRLNQVSGVRAGVSCEQINLAELPVDFERLFNVTTSLRRPRGLRARLHSPQPGAPNPASLPTHLEGRRPPAPGGRHGFFACRIISQVSGSSEAPGLGEIALEVWLHQLFFRRGDRIGSSRLFFDPQRADLDAGA